MTRKAFNQIAEGLNEAIAVARGEAKPYKLHIPSPINVRAIRKSLHESQEEFALEFGFTLDQVRNWEQERTSPTHGEGTYLLLIARRAAEIRKLRDEVCEEMRGESLVAA